MERFGATCEMLGSGSMAAAAACLAVAALLLAVIALGFGPLRSWLAPGGARPVPPGRVGQIDDGVLSIWRLYRQLRRAAPHAR